MTFPKGAGEPRRARTRRETRPRDARRWLVLRKLLRARRRRRWEGKLTEQRPPPKRTRDPGDGHSKTKQPVLESSAGQVCPPGHAAHAPPTQMEWIGPTGQDG